MPHHIAKGDPVAAQQRVHQKEAGDLLDRTDEAQISGETTCQRKQPQRAKEDDLQDQSQKEGRHGDAKDRAGPYPHVQRFAFPAGADDAQRNAHYHGDEHSSEQQLQRRGQPAGDLFQNRPFGADGGAQIAVQHAAHVDQVLGGQRLVQPQLLGHALDFGRARPRPDVQRGRVGWDDTRQGEGDDGDADQHEQRGAQPAQNEFEFAHGVKVAVQLRVCHPRVGGNPLCWGLDFRLRGNDGQTPQLEVVSTRGGSPSEDCHPCDNYAVKPGATALSGRSTSGARRGSSGCTGSRRCGPG